MAKLIDPIYKKYASKVIGTLANTEFYNYFMDVMRAGQNSVQFSNRRIEKSVDERWVIAVEAVIRPLQEIINNPRNFIMQEEIVVNVALSKSITPDTIRHLSQHGSMIDMVTEDNVRPNRLKQNFKEDSWNTYENRFVYTLLEMAWEFVDKRYKAIFDALNEEYGAYLKMSSDAKSYQERIQTNIDIRIQQEEDLLSVDEKNQSIFARIARLHRLLSSFKDSSFAREMPRYGKIRPPLVRTNAIAKNPNLKACHKLWDFLLAYQDVGYSIEIYEQSAEISDEFMEDIMHSIMFDYIILKNYLEQTRDRAIDTSKPFRKKKIKPQYIKEIIEELVKNYDLPDVEIRKVLIEEITKAQLLKEEEAERRRLVEEKEKEMRERARQEKLEKERQARAAERERLRLEKEREKEAARLEKERQAELARQEKERQRIEQEENLRLDRFRAELNLMMKDREDILQKRAKAAEAERRRMEAESERQRLAEEKRLQEEARKAEQERIRLEKIAELEAQRKAREEEKRRVKEELERQKEEEKKRAAAEKEKLRIEREAAAQKEKERLAKEKAKEKERLAKETAAQKEKQRLAKEKAKEKERLAKEAAAQKEKERLAKEKAKEKERLAKEKAKEKERLTKEKVKEKERLAKDKGRVAKEKTGKTREKKVETPVMEESGMPQQTLEMNVVNMAADSYDLTAEKAEEVVVEAAMEAAMEAAIEAVQDVAEEVAEEIAEEIALEVAAEAAVEAAIEAVQEVVEAAEVEVAEEAMVDAVVEAAIEAVQEAAAEAVEETTEEATVEAVIEAVQKAVEATAEEAAVETEAVDAAEDNKPADKAADSKAGVHTEGKKERKSQDWRGMLRGLLGRKNKE